MAKKIVVGFPVETYDIDTLTSLTDREKHENALFDNNSIIFDCVNDFFSELNANYVDTENNYFFCIEID